MNCAKQMAGNLEEPSKITNLVTLLLALAEVVWITHFVCRRVFHIKAGILSKYSDNFGKSRPVYCPNGPWFET